MKTNCRAKLQLGLMVVGLLTIVLMIGCSEMGPTSSNEAVWVPPPPMTPEHIADAFPLGYTPVYCSENSNGMTTESDTLFRQQFIHNNEDKEVSLDHFKVKVWDECIHEDILLTMTIPSPNVFAIDFGPHPYQFDSPVRIKIDYHSHIPFGPARDALTTLYWNGYTQTYEFVQFTNDTDHGIITAWTNHFSRYVIATGS
jgi:hypothetical protein